MVGCHEIGCPLIVPSADHPRHVGPTVQPVTLLLLHSTSFHKEIYEPMLEELFTIVGDSSRDGDHGETELSIKEVWAIDCPNHGQAAVLNCELLKRPEYKEYCECKGRML